jgi:hypothetical protein
MNRYVRPMLMEAVNTMSPEQFHQVPEISTLIALDANLFAAITALELQHPDFYPGGEPQSDAEFHIMGSICSLASALRISLAAYYDLYQGSDQNRNHLSNSDDIQF